MALSTSQERPANGNAARTGPSPGTVKAVDRWVFEQDIQQRLSAIGMTEAKEDNVRLQGVAWIDSVRKSLQMPVKTYNTACVYYHKFRLKHADSSYDYRDAAAAALFVACKIEDTLKKSRDVLCAAYNAKCQPAEYLSSDDPLFENPAKVIFGMERLMLEASHYDFKNRHPNEMLFKIAKSCDLDKNVGVVAFSVSLDLYRTFAPLKQCSCTMALACLELAIRLCDIDLASVRSKHKHGLDYARMDITREEIMETLLDLLDLYSHHRAATVVGPSYPLDKFISIRITLNQEASANSYPRYTRWDDNPPADTKKPSASTPTTNGKVSMPSSTTPKSPSATGFQFRPVGDNGRDATVRFIFNPERARRESATIKEYFELEEVEEYV